ncbi:hypothetical protein HN958_00815 [Candidatus Falkowbacteria bacterium]|jgi:hypothetical protein|nr:hypothetical protein [Candidatus Falkowbacteria bacterium]MBT7007032.1 hypothetical protein [Candidatus Falkowbacteria bacterium]
MKIYVGHSKQLDNEEQLYQPIRDSLLNDEHQFILPHEIHKEFEKVKSIDIIKNCDLMIAEVSFSATGLGIELGWANAFNCPIIFIYKKGSKLAGSLKLLSDDFIEYDSSKDMIEKIRNILKKM